MRTPRDNEGYDPNDDQDNGLERLHDSEIIKGGGYVGNLKNRLILESHRRNANAQTEAINHAVELAGSVKDLLTIIKNRNT
jgi:hypothetical protein